MTAAVMAVFFIVFWISPISAPGSTTMMTQEFIRQYQLESSYDQRTAFLISVLVTALLSAAAFFINQRRILQNAGNRAIPTINIWLSVLVTAVGLAIYSKFIQRWIVVDAAILATCFFLFVFFAPHLRRRTIEVCALLIIGAYLAIVVIPGFIIWPMYWPVADADSIAQIELHINSLVQPGTNVAAGQNFFSDIAFGYGLLMPSVLSVIERRFGELTAGDHARFVQYCQVAFTVTATVAYFCYRPRNYVGILVALLLAAPYWASTGLGIWHPNQTGYRSLTLPLGILAMALAGRLKPNTAAAMLGAVGMIDLLINVETAVAVCGGMVVYIVLRARKVPLVQFSFAAIGGALTFILCLVLYKIALGRLPFAINFQTFLDTLRAHVSGDVGLRLFTSGIWGEGYYLVPIALIMFAHAIFIVVASFQKLGDRVLSHRQALRAGIATILIAWFAYYINFPNWWQIWTHLFLYGFLVIDLFDLRLFAIGTALRNRNVSRRLRVRATHVLPMLLLSIAILHTNSNLAYFTRDFLSPYWTNLGHSTAVISQMQLPRAAGDALTEKSKFLQELYAQNPGKVVYLTYNVEFVPMLTRIFEPTPIRSLWGFIHTDAELDPAIAKVFTTKPVAILIDAPTGPLAVSGARKDFQDRVRKSVSRAYHLAETTAGWQIWRPTTP
jgi:hypothetical protein